MRAYVHAHTYIHTATLHYTTARYTALQCTLVILHGTAHHNTTLHAYVQHI